MERIGGSENDKYNKYMEAPRDKKISLSRILAFYTIEVNGKSNSFLHVWYYRHPLSGCHCSVYIAEVSRQYGSQSYRQHASFIINSAGTEGRERGFGTGNKWTHSSFNTTSSPPRFSEMVYHRKEQDMPMSAGQSLGRAGLRVGRLPAHKHDYKPFLFGPLSSLQTISLPYKRL